MNYPQNQPSCIDSGVAPFQTDTADPSMIEQSTSHRFGMFDRPGQTQVWHAQHFESGFHSGAPSGPTTAAPSLSGFESLTDRTTDELDSQGFVPGLTQETKVSQPDVYIPHITKLLYDEDPCIVRGALQTVARLSKSKLPLEAIIQSEPVVRALVAALEPQTDQAGSQLEEALEATKAAATVLKNMSMLPSGRQAITLSGGFRALINLLASATDSIMFYAITILHTHLINRDSAELAKVAIRSGNGIYIMVSFLARNNIKLSAIVTDCLHILTKGNAASKLEILKHNGTVMLVEIMRQHKYEKLLWTTSRLLKVLSVCSKNKPVIIDAGGMEALAALCVYPLEYGSDRMTANCIWTLRNLSDAGAQKVDFGPYAETIVRLLNHSDSNTVTCAAGIISNLTCNNQGNKSAFCRAGAVEAIVSIVRTQYMHQPTLDYDIIEPCMTTLNHLSNNHVDAETAQNLMCHSSRLDVLGMLAYVLQSCLHTPTVKAVLGTLRNLATNPDHRIVLRQRGFLAELIGLLSKTWHLIGQPPPNGEVRIEDIVEYNIAALLVLAKDNENRSIIGRDNQVIGILGELVHKSQSDNILRVSTGLLCELSACSESCILMLSEGSKIGVCVDALRFHVNERIASYATAILIKLDEMKQMHCVTTPSGGGGINEWTVINQPDVMSAGSQNVNYGLDEIPLQPMVEDFGLAEAIEEMNFTGSW